MGWRRKKYSYSRYISRCLSSLDPSSGAESGREAIEFETGRSEVNGFEAGRGEANGCEAGSRETDGFEADGCAAGGRAAGGRAAIGRGGSEEEGNGRDRGELLASPPPVADH